MKPEHPPARSNPVMRAPSGSDESTGPGGADESALVARARLGDEAAFRILVDRYRDRAYGLAVRMLRSTADAEDVTQEAFVRAWHALPAFRGDAGFGTWLHAIVARRALDRLAQMKRRRGREAELDAAGDVAAPDVKSPERETARRLEALMERLSAPQRAVIALFYYEDRSVEDVAIVLGMPENTVKTHLSRARAALREGWMKAEGDTR
ncbi:MAG TPA: sigma-70 family RNA polymerase sigma factor [Candidatus Saccharimonadaceae bacterium]|nr:sigma-70 family RNA polymerase sigma factor [Candidatus Saccharimonadaceae bacterium]